LSLKESVSEWAAGYFGAPILMLSANIGDGSSVSADNGHDDLIAKPFDLRQLLDKMQKYLDLVWIEDKAGDGTSALSPVSPPAPRSEKPLVPLAVEQVRELVGLAEIGYVRGIEAKLAALADDPDLRPLVDVLRERVRAFDFAGFNRLLEENVRR